VRRKWGKTRSGLAATDRAPSPMHGHQGPAPHSVGHIIMNLNSHLEPLTPTHNSPSPPLQLSSGWRDCRPSHVRQGPAPHSVGHIMMNLDSPKREGPSRRVAVAKNVVERWAGRVELQNDVAHGVRCRPLPEARGAILTGRDEARRSSGLGQGPAPHSVGHIILNLNSHSPPLDVHRLDVHRDDSTLVGSTFIGSTFIGTSRRSSVQVRSKMIIPPTRPPIPNLAEPCGSTQLLDRHECSGAASLSCRSLPKP